jgi:hypothetical protein
MAQCCICHREVNGNVTPGIITLAYAFRFLTATKENKIAYREKLISEGKLEEARTLSHSSPR